jgi:hypothetical protein
VSLLDKVSTTWFEIAQSFKLFYNSPTSITDSVDQDSLESRIYVGDNLVNLSEHYKLESIGTVIMNGEFR